MFIGLEAIPLDEQVEGGDGERQPRQDVIDHPMHDLFEMADQGQHREHGFDQHAVVPGAAPAELGIERIAGAGVEAGIGQDDHTLLEVLNQGMKPGVVGVGRQAHPTDDFTPVVGQQAQFNPHDPAVVRESFTTDLGRAAPLSNRMDQFDAVTIDNTQQRWRRQEQQRPLLMGLELTKQPGPLGQVRKQRVVIPRQPAIERAVADPLQGVQHPQSHDFTGPQHRLGVFGQGAHPVVDPAEQIRDEVDGGHGRSPLAVNRST